MSPDQRVTRGTQVNTRIKEHTTRNFGPNQAHQRRDRCSKCGDSKHIEGFKHPARKFQCKTCNNYGHCTSLCYKKKVSFKSGICSQASDLTSSDESFCLQVQIQCTQANTKIPTPHNLITNLAYRLKPHHLRARLDTCANVNIMPASVYKLLFQDPDCKKLAHSKLEIGTCTTNSHIGWILCISPGTSRHKMPTRSNILCSQ